MEACQVIVDVVEAMGLGKAISVMPVDQRMTTQQAADLLGISRPTLIKLLETEAIPFECPSGSRHRRIRLDDLLEYQEKHRHASRESLDALSREAFAEGLCDASPDDYRSALESARKGR